MSWATDVFVTDTRFKTHLLSLCVVNGISTVTRHREETKRALVKVFSEIKVVAALNAEVIGLLSYRSLNGDGFKMRRQCRLLILLDEHLGRLPSFRLSYWLAQVSIDVD